MGVLDGQAVDAAVTNPAFINKNQNDQMPNQLGFTRALSGTSIADIQAAVNKIYTATGASETQSGTTYNATAGTITNGQSYQTALGELAGKFSPSTGHFHTGAAGDGPIISTAAISNTPATPQSVSGSDLVGSSGNFAWDSHQHQGVHSFAISGGTQLFSDVTLTAGANIQMTLSGQNIQISAPTSAGTGGSFAQAAVTGATSLSAPAAAFGFTLMALDSNSQNINWAIGATAAAATGMQLEPGRDTGFIPCAAAISVCPAGGTQIYAIQWLTQ